MVFYFSSSFSTNKTEIVWKNRRKFQKIIFEVFSFFVFCRKTDRIQKRETELLKFIVKLLNSINYGII